jgi:hypothetical protein
MPLTSSAPDVLGVATLVLVLLLVCAGLGCVAYVLYFRARIQRERLPALQVHIYVFPSVAVSCCWLFFGFCYQGA